MMTVTRLRSHAVARRFLALSAFLFIGSCNAFQEPVTIAPAVHGIVYDAATRQPIDGVRIEVAGHITTTAANGSYSIADVPHGMQALTASKTSYATYVTDVQVATGVTEKKFYLQTMN